MGVCGLRLPRITPCSLARMAPQIPRIISVDDHVIEPPNVWQDRLPEKFKAVGPRIERRKVKNMKFVGGVFSYDTAADNEDGLWCDWWLVEDLQYPLTRLSAAAGYPREVTVGIVGNNLLNENIRNHVSYTKNEVLMPGTSVRAFANVKF